MSRTVFNVMLAGLFIGISASDSVTVRTHPVEGRILYPGNKQTPFVVPPTTRISLNGGEFETLSRVDGSFVFHNVPAGIYSLDVLSTRAYFSQVKIKIPEEKDGNVQCVEYRYPGAQKKPITCMEGNNSMRLVAHAPIHYFEQRPKVSIIGMLMGQPMILMMMVFGAIAYFFPGALDMKELAEQAKEQNRKMAEQNGVPDPLANIDTSDPMALLGQLWRGELDPAVAQQAQQSKTKQQPVRQQVQQQSQQQATEHKKSGSSKKRDKKRKE